MRKFFILFVILLTMLLLNILTTFYISNLNNNNVPNPDIFYKHSKNLNIEKEFLQSKEYTCGPAALRYLLFLYGYDISESTISLIAGTEQKGTTLSGLKKAVEMIGFEGIGLKGDFESLKSIRKPVIAYINNNHYIVIENIKSNNIYAFDPQIGYIKVHYSDFLKVWKGIYFKIKTMKLEGE
ncbi:cysteine peptidase family C39 domain-containing protein [Marinitoga lauensis]|uniref:cysteine peptidase family C39 domain-containing protein n=1 Tax=Marinitoga lauensis TaxID=2201189 RepID=UPI001011601D|nr:cysteine peptidase family C39 domain-containing protein [Marinitoga lauensis]